MADRFTSRQKQQALARELGFRRKDEGVPMPGRVRPTAKKRVLMRERPIVPGLGNDRRVLVAIDDHINILTEVADRGGPSDDLEIWHEIRADYFNAYARQAIISGSIPEPNCGCWLWSGSTSEGGYGQINLYGRMYIAPRLSHLVFKGAPGHLFVCHSCDLPACVNPDHLWLGTHAENMADMVAKGRHTVPRGDEHFARRAPDRMARGDRNGSRLYPERRPRGEANKLSKLTSEQVKAIFLARGTVAEIGERYGIAPGHVSRIKRGTCRAAETAEMRQRADAEDRAGRLL